MPVPLLLLAGVYTVFASVLVAFGVPWLLAAGTLATLAGAHVAAAGRMGLRTHGARQPTTDETPAYEEMRHTLQTVAAAAGIEVPALRVGLEDDRGARPVARSRRAATVIVAPGLLRAGEATRQSAVSLAVAEIATGEAVNVTVAAVPAALGVAPLTRLLLWPGGDRREAATARVAAGVDAAVGTGPRGLPAVPYRDFLRA